MTRKSELSAISLFSGAGGMDFGFHAAGFRPAVAVEFDGHCCATLRANTDTEVIEDDIHNVTGSEIASVAASNRDVDLVFGGPPCQPFSKAGYWSRGDTLRLDDPRASTLGEFIRIVEEVTPAAFVLENVHGINYSGKEEGLQLLFDRIASVNRAIGTNYEPHWTVLNAAEYGVPQLRKRFFLVAHREGRRFQFPEPTHGAKSDEPGLFDLDIAPFTTAWDAIGDLCDEVHDEDISLKGRWADLVPSIPEGENYLWHTDRKGGMNLFGWRTRYWSFLLKLAKSLPSWTIQAQPGPAIGPFHWLNRRLSSRELCRLQTFPDTIELQGPRRSIQMQAGNAVPSLLAEVIGLAIRQQWFDRSPARKPSLLPEFRGAPPPPEQVSAVSRKFWPLEGEHAEHPGTGKGRGARRRNREIAQQEAK